MIKHRNPSKLVISALSSCLTTCQQRWVIMCRFPKKGIEALVEESRDIGEDEVISE